MPASWTGDEDHRDLAMKRYLEARTRSAAFASPDLASLLKELFADTSAQPNSLADTFAQDRGLGGDEDPPERETVAVECREQGPSSAEQPSSDAVSRNFKYPGADLDAQVTRLFKRGAPGGPDERVVEEQRREIELLMDEVDDARAASSQAKSGEARMARDVSDQRERLDACGQRLELTRRELSVRGVPAGLLRALMATSGRHFPPKILGGVADQHDFAEATRLGLIALGISGWFVTPEGDGVLLALGLKERGTTI